MFSWSAFFLYCFVSTITPGPNNVASMAWGMNVGFFKALPFNAGIMTGFCIVMGLCGVFCATLNALLPQIIFPIKVLGTLYLLWLAWKIWIAEYNIKADDVQFGKAFMSGLFLQFVNVKIYVYGILSLQIFILPFFSNNWALAAFAVFLAAMGSSCNLIWSAGGTACAKLFKQYRKVVNGILAISLVVCAISFW